MPLYTVGLVHVTYADPSMLHWSVAVGSVSLKMKLAVVAVVGFAGPLVIAGEGGAGGRATCHWYEAARL